MLQEAYCIQVNRDNLGRLQHMLELAAKKLGTLGLLPVA